MAKLQFKVCDQSILKLISNSHYDLNEIKFAFFVELTNQYYDSRTLRKVCGLLGTIKLISGKYLVVATHREFVGVINNQVVWRLAGHDLIPYIPSLIHLSETQVRIFIASHSKH